MVTRITMVTKVTVTTSYIPLVMLNAVSLVVMVLLNVIAVFGNALLVFALLYKTSNR